LRMLVATMTPSVSTSPSAWDSHSSSHSTKTRSTTGTS
jgi:hypothetical protein